MNTESLSTIALVVVMLSPVFCLILGFLWIKSIRLRKALVEAAEQKLEQALTAEKEQQNKLSSVIQQYEEKYEPILEIEREVNNQQEKLQSAREEFIALKEDYNAKRPLLDELKKQMAVFDDSLALAELGVYEPSFNFDDSDDYKHELEGVRADQKNMISDKTAVVANRAWIVEDSRSKGEAMNNRNVRLTLRAFNNECAAAISNVKWNNANAILKRMENARNQIDKANKSNDITISEEFYQLKLQELRLTHEYKEKRQEERELAKEVARQEREEARLIRDAEQARKDEQKYQKLLEEVRADAGLMSSEEHQAKIVELQKQLDVAHQKTERAEAMAERTKSGFVYIISNVGSFGENVVKIGLTRRVDPFDRVKELGDASVPFLFDTHAMIYSDDAPDLEGALHKEFEEKRINTANYRKEFFKVSLDEVEGAVKRLQPDASFFRDVEAREFKETLLMREKALNEKADVKADLPESI
jgi:hypothetical protein